MSARSTPASISPERRANMACACYGCFDPDGGQPSGSSACPAARFPDPDRPDCDRFMQSYNLTVDKFLDHAAKWHGDRQIVEADAGRSAATIGYAELRLRANRFSGALLSLGLRFGD